MKATDTSCANSACTSGAGRQAADKPHLEPARINDLPGYLISTMRPASWCRPSRRCPWPPSRDALAAPIEEK
jgi:hypothetical protein